MYSHFDESNVLKKMWSSHYNKIEECGNFVAKVVMWALIGWATHFPALLGEGI